MRIAFVIRVLEVGGAERQLLNLSRGLLRRGHSVSIVTLYGAGSLEEDFRRAGVVVRSLERRSRWEVVRPLRRLVGMIHAEHPQVVHGYLTAGNLFASLARPFSRRIGTVWGLRASDMDLHRYGSFVRLTSEVERRLSPSADRIIVNSEAGRRHAERLGFPAPKLRLVPNGIDTDEFRPDPDAGMSVRREWGIGAGEKLVGLVARLDPMKDHEVFLRAGARLVASDPHLRLVCVGDGASGDFRHLRDLAASLDLGERLLWTGMRSDMRAVYNSLDLLCSTSCWGEGFPNVVAEAMACGVRCVVTDVGDAARVVAESGAVVPPKDSSRLAAAIEAALGSSDDEAGSLRRRRWIVDEFGLDRLVERTEAVLSEVAEGRE